MDQVAAVLDALSDAKETTRQQVIGLVERIALQLEEVEATNQQLVRENQLLRDQLNMVGDDSEGICHLLLVNENSKILHCNVKKQQNLFIMRLAKNINLKKQISIIFFLVT